MKELYLNTELRTELVQKKFNSKKKFYREYFEEDAHIYTARLKEGLESKYNVKLK